MWVRSLAWLSGMEQGEGRERNLDCCGWCLTQRIPAANLTCNLPLHVPRSLQGLKHFTHFISLDGQQRSEGVAEMSQSNSSLDAGLQTKILGFQCSMCSWHSFPNLAVHPKTEPQPFLLQLPGPHYRLRS